MQVVTCQYLNGGSGIANRIGATRRRRDIHFEQLLDRELLPLTLIGAGGLLSEGSGGPHHASQQGNNGTQGLHSVDG